MPSAPDPLVVLHDEPPTAGEGATYRDAGDAESGHLLVEFRWLEPAVISLTVFVVFWNGVLAFVYAAILFGSAAPGAAWFPLLLVIIGASVTWQVAAGWLNRTRIETRRGLLTVRSGPLPFPGVARSRRLELDLVEGFEERKVFVWWHMERRTPERWAVVARMRDGTSVRLAPGLEHKPARFLARRLDRQLAPS